MNKIPQFKVWCHDSNNWLNKSRTYINCMGDTLEPTSKFKNDEYSEWIIKRRSVTICNFIDYLDIDGTPIYEGDILECWSKFRYFGLKFKVIKHFNH